MRAGVSAAVHLKVLLDQFAEATGLAINFHKSTLVPMHTEPEEVALIQTALGCRVEGFPQTYLGLPLSAMKLRLQDFAPLIARIDRYLSGWCAILLTYGGRIVLLNAVLDALPIFAMGALDLPPALLRIIEGLRRSFLWSNADRTSGAKCLVAWKDVCRPKQEGGLGIKSLADKNRCLQMKFVHRLFSDPSAPWPKWFWQNGGTRRFASGPHADHLAGLLPLYRNLSTCQVGDGRHTSFWLDSWIGRPLYGRFPALFSRALDKEVCVGSMLSAGISSTLVPRLNTSGHLQLPLILDILASAPPLSGDVDKRCLSRCSKRGGALDAAELLKLCTWGGCGRPLPRFRLEKLCPPPKGAILRVDSLKGQNAHPERAGEEAYPHSSGGALPSLRPPL
jgi:hypothetical protein